MVRLDILGNIGGDGNIGRWGVYNDDDNGNNTDIGWKKDAVVDTAGP